MCANFKRGKKRPDRRDSIFGLKSRTPKGAKAHRHSLIVHGSYDEIPDALRRTHYECGCCRQIGRRGKKSDLQHHATLVRLQYRRQARATRNTRSDP